MHHALALPLVLSVLMTACKDAPSGPPGAGSATASAPASSSGADDLSPAIELKAPRPRYALADLSDKQLERMVARAGWTPTVVGKSPPSEGQSTVRVGAYRKTGGQQLEAAVLVRCRKDDDRSATFQPGEAYFRDGGCQMVATVHLGIRNKSAESQRLLEALLAASAD